MSVRNESDNPLDILLAPASVVVVGATNNPIKYGNMVVQSLHRIGYQGALYLVNAHRETIMGMRSYARVVDIPGTAEAAIIVVPAEHVPETLGQCGSKGVRLAVVITGGFNEVDDPQGLKLFQEMRAVAERFGIRIIGPNTFGACTPAARFNASFTPDFAELRPGKISIVSQSGGVAHMMAFQAMREGLGVRCVVGVGNRANVEFHNMVKFFGDDAETAVIGLYLEGIDDPRELIESSRTVTPRKPILVYKVGKSRAVELPARSHTGSLCGSYALYKAALRQAGILWTESPQELMDAAKLFTIEEPLHGDRVAIMSIQAGAALMLADLCVSMGLELATLSPETRQALSHLLPPKTYINNPVDMGFMWLPPVFIEVAKRLLEDDAVDIVIMYALALPGPMTEMLKWVASQLIPYRQRGKILMLCTDIGTCSLYEELAAIEQMGVPVYVSPERAMRSLAHKVRYEEIKRRTHGTGDSDAACYASSPTSRSALSAASSVPMLSRPTSDPTR